MIARGILAVTLLAALAGCHPDPKGPGEAGKPVYYDPARGISSDGLLYRQR